MPFKTLEFISRAGINPLKKQTQLYVHLKIWNKDGGMNMFGPFEFPNIKFSVLSDIGGHTIMNYHPYEKATTLQAMI